MERSNAYEIPVSKFGYFSRWRRMGTCTETTIYPTYHFVDFCMGISFKQLRCEALDPRMLTEKLVPFEHPTSGVTKIEAWQAPETNENALLSSGAAGFLAGTLGVSHSISSPSFNIDRHYRCYHWSSM